MRNLLGIIGKPLDHSLSPLLHNKAIEKLKINYKYESWELDESELEGFLQSVRNKNSLIAGFNVTIPYKEKIIPYLDELDPLARVLKAVNTVKYEDGKLKGYNTDSLGFLETLKRNNIEYEEKNILILGSGGACNGIALFLANKKVKRIDIVARNNNKSKIICESLKTIGIKSDSIIWDDLAILNIEKYNIIIQTTPIGLKSNYNEIEFPYSKLNKNHTILDIIYNPILTTFLKKGMLYGARGINGLEMLVYQGYFSFKIWTNLEEDTALMLKTAKLQLEDKSE